MDDPTTKNNTLTYTRQGMTKAVSSEVWPDGKKYYTKKNLTDKQIDNFRKLEQLGIGIKLKEYSYEDHSVTMEAGDSLQKILDKKRIAEAKIALEELPKIYNVLKKNKIAHCDVKPANLVYKEGKYFLIDNDDIVNFGEIRKVGTPGLNGDYNTLMKG